MSFSSVSEDPQTRLFAQMSPFVLNSYSCFSDLSPIVILPLWQPQFSLGIYGPSLKISLHSPKWHMYVTYEGSGDDGKNSKREK